MSLDGKLLAKAARELEKRRRRDRDELAARRGEVYARVPALRGIDTEIASSVIGAVSEALKSGGDVGRAVEDIAARNLELQADRAELLVENGYAPDYIDEKYRCGLCRDTGHTQHGICSCLMQLYNSERSKELLSLPGDGTESFDGFNLGYYDSKPDPKTGIAPRPAMELVLGTCRAYAENFNEKSMNLLLQGPPGLGKTYLAVCIARAVGAAGVPVVFETAAGAAARFESQKFSRDAKIQEEAADGVRRLTECELLVLDDLGAEIPTSFSAGALYSLINARLIGGGKTVTVTNLGLEELRRRYPAGLISRLEGEFKTVPFCGGDIRLIKSAL